MNRGDLTLRPYQREAVASMKTETYYGVHRRLRVERGPASDHHCQFCGKAGGRKEWAYLHTSGDRELVGGPGRYRGMKYSTDIWNDYAPLCVKCHRNLDMEQDPDWVKKIKDHSRELGMSMLGKPKKPGQAEKTWVTRKKQMEDPEVGLAHHEKYSRLMSTTNSKRYNCNECGYENNAGNIGWHQKKTGHQGRTPAPTVPA